MRKRIVARFRSTFAFGARAPRPTGAGGVVLVATALAGGLAAGTGDLALRFVFGALLALLLVSFVLPVLNLRRISVERLPVEDVHAGEPFPVAAVLAREGGRFERFAIALEDGVDGPWTRPGHALALRVGADPVTVRYRVRVKDRGRHEIRTAALVTSFPCGLFRYRRTLEVPGEVLVYPRIGVFRDDPVPWSAFTRVMTSTETTKQRGQEEFRNLREYRPGDNPRLVAWKASARVGELMVKELTDDLTRKVTIFLESRLPPDARRRDELRVERAISFAASLVRELARRRHQVTLYSLGPDPARISAGRGGRRLPRVMERLAMLEPSRSSGVEALLAIAPPETFLTTLPIFVLPSLEDGEGSAKLWRLSARCRPLVYRADGAWERSLFGYHDDEGAFE